MRFGSANTFRAGITRARSKASAFVRSGCGTTVVRFTRFHFGLLGAIQNQSRDWVIDKLTVGITYDSDPVVQIKQMVPVPSSSSPPLKTGGQGRKLGQRR